MPQPWERLTTESAQAYAAFCLYRDMGSTRSLNAAWRGRGVGAAGAQGAPGTWRDWAKRFRWAERAVAYDNRLVAAEMKGREKAAESEAEELERKRRTVIDIEYKVALQLFVAEAKRIKEGDTRGSGANLEVASRLLRRSMRMPAEVEPAPPVDLKSMLFETSGQFAEAMPAGATPAMPEDVLTKPHIDAAVTAGNGPALIQPGKVTR